MKCSKCGKDFDSAFCPNCGSPRPAPEPATIEPQKKLQKNPAGVWAFIVSLLTLIFASRITSLTTDWVIIPFILASVALTIIAFRAANAKNLKKGLTITAMVFCCLSGAMLLSVVITGPNGSVKAAYVERQKQFEESTKQTPLPTPTATPVPTVSATLGERNALDKAYSYLNFMAFSYKGLIEQLEFEGFSHDEAIFGVDHCEADWNEQAALKAAQYLESSSFSRSGLIDQLEFEGFTTEQAEYGVSQVGY